MIFKELTQPAVPLHCTATRPKLLNIQYLSFLNPVACFDEILENQRLHILMFFVFFRLLEHSGISYLLISLQ